MGAAIRKVLLATVLAAGGAWVTLVAVMMLLETRLVYPAPDPAQKDWQPDLAGREEFACQSADGTRVHGWILRGAADSDLAIVFFHGNAEDVADCGPGIGQRLRDRLGATVLVFDYRGFGRTGGIPSEPRVIADGVAAVREFARRLGTTPDHLVFYGRSLGGGVAVGVARETGAGLLVLDRTFDSLPAAAAANYPWLPCGWLMRNQFRSADRIRHLDIPLLQSHFEGDEIVPVRSAEALFAASPAQDRLFLRYPGGGHLQRLPDEWWSAAVPFLRKHAPGRH